MKSFIFVALVAVIAGVAHGTPLTQRFETHPLEELGITMVQVEEIIYTVGATAKTSDVTLCINETIADMSATIVIVDGSSQTDVPGTQTPADQHCYKFTNVSFPEDKDLVTYELNLHKDGERFGPLGYLKYTFHKVPKVSAFDCAGKEFNRITYESSGDAVSGQHCLMGTSNICYGNFNISGAGKGSLCLPSQNQVSKEGLIFCQPGTINKFEMGAHVSNYLDYDGFYAFSDDGKNASASEAILIEDGDFISVTAQTDNHVKISKFAPSTKNYHVCSVKLDKAGGSMQAAYQSSVQDLSVHGQIGPNNCFISFMNMATDKQYTLDGGKASVSVGCERIQHGGACFSSTECNGTTILELEYADKSNAIQVNQDKLTDQ